MSNQPEPAPTHTEGVAIWDLVVADMNERNAMGVAKYGTPLQAHNGRKPLIDAYQEVLDLAVYLRQEVAEHGDRAARLQIAFAQMRKDGQGLSLHQEQTIRSALGL